MKRILPLIFLFMLSCAVTVGISSSANAESCDHYWDIDYSRTAEATLSNSGYISYYCSNCGATKKETIAFPKTFKLSKTSYTYNGEDREPSVSVWDSKGKRISSDNYWVYYEDNYSVGTAKAYVYFGGNYSGTKTLKFTINPRGTSIKKILSQPKGFAIKWKDKYDEELTGYQVQYSQSKSFASGNKIVNVNNKYANNTRVVKLKAKKRYYVRIRLIHKISGKNYYSNWSTAGSVKTKTTKNKKSYCHNLNKAHPGFYLCYCTVRNEYPTYYECDATVYMDHNAVPGVKKYKERIRISKKCRVTYYDWVNVLNKKTLEWDGHWKRRNLSLKSYAPKDSCTSHVFVSARMVNSRGGTWKGKTTFNKKGYLTGFVDGVAE